MLYYKMTVSYMLLLLMIEKIDHFNVFNSEDN